MMYIGETGKTFVVRTATETQDKSGTLTKLAHSVTCLLLAVPRSCD